MRMRHAALEAFPKLVTRVAAVVPAAKLVEHVWHLAELEREGFQLRLTRLLQEDAPHLLDFDGDAIARERGYSRRSVAEGLTAFLRARQETVHRLRQVRGSALLRSGWQDGVGRVVVRELPERIATHDRAHGAEMLELVERGNAVHSALKEFLASKPSVISSPCRSATGTLPRLEEHLVEHLGSTRLLNEVSEALGLSVRTLQRRLTQRGLSISCLAQEARLTFALEELCSGRSVHVAAMAAGYSDRRALLRALKRWTGGGAEAIRAHC